MKWSLGLYIALPSLMLAVGFVSNILCLLTLRQPTIESSTTTRYIQLAAITSQLTLFAVFFQTAYVILNRFDFLGHTRFNTLLCHTCSYALHCFAYTNKWLIGVLSIYRAHNTRQIRTMVINHRRQNRIMILGILVIIFSLNAVEIGFHHLVIDPRNSQHQLVCIVEYTEPIWQTIETISRFCNHLIPFLLNIYATSIIIVTVARSKAKLYKSKCRMEVWKQIKNRYEQLICPMAMIVCSTPHLLVGFFVHCHDLDKVIQRKLIVIVYLISFFPEMLTFCLFILPSKKFKHVFLATQMAKFSTIFGTLTRSNGELDM
jgi:hypothetical protein